MIPGFSSTPGVQIVSTRFNEINYNSSAETVKFGSGLRFNDIYDALAPYNHSIAGARVSGVGVGGFLLGGGMLAVFEYELFITSHSKVIGRRTKNGLKFDTTVAYKLVKPKGQVVKLTEQSDPELFFGLKDICPSFTLADAFAFLGRLE